MGLFSSNTKPTSELLAKTAADAVSVFQTTITKLKEVVDSAKVAISNNQKEINALQAENTKLEKVVTDNTTMASKLSDLFNPAPSSSSDEAE